jgi:acyl carrier protein
VIAVDWDAWADVGMATEAATPSREAFLAQAIRADEGRDAFLRILAASAPQIVVSPLDLESRVARSRHLQEQPEEAEAPAAEKHERPKIATDYVAPSNAMETDVVEVVQSLLGLDRVGVQDNLFELGFDSLMAHRMVARLKEDKQLDLSVRVVLESPKVAEIAKYLRAAQWAATAGRAKSQT